MCCYKSKFYLIFEWIDICMFSAKTTASLVIKLAIGTNGYKDKNRNQNHEFPYLSTLQWHFLIFIIQNNSYNDD